MNDKSPRQDLTRKLTVAREKKRLTQAEVGKLTDMNKNYYARIERGFINVSYDKLKKITEALDIKLLP